MGTEEDRQPSDADGDHARPMDGHRFPAERRQILKDTERLRWLPPLEHRLAQREIEAFLGDAGLVVEQLESPNAGVYVVLGRLITDNSV